MQQVQVSRKTKLYNTTQYILPQSSVKILSQQANPARKPRCKTFPGKNAVNFRFTIYLCAISKLFRVTLFQCQETNCVHYLSFFTHQSSQSKKILQSLVYAHAGTYKYLRYARSLLTCTFIHKSRPFEFYWEVHLRRSRFPSLS